MNLSLDTLTDLVRRGLHKDLAEAFMHPALARTVDTIYPRSLSAYHRVLLEPFEKARAANPFLTLREFIATSGRQQQNMLRKALGPDGYVMAVEHSGANYFAARLNALKAGRPATSPVSDLLGWGHWGRTVPVIDTTGRPSRILPLDFPVQRRVNGVVQWVYPDFNTGRQRLFCNLGFLELQRRNPTITIPTSGGAADLLRTLNLPHDPTPKPFPGVAGLHLSDLQVAKMLQTGSVPPYKTILLKPGTPAPPGFELSAGKGHFGAADARWELASRLGNPDLVLSGSFDRNIAKHPTAMDTTAPTGVVNPDHPVTTLSNAELVAIARYEVGCWEVAQQTYQVEHRRAQRTLRQLQSIMDAVDADVDTSLLANLVGLCDPHNLAIVTPEGHGAADFFAYYVQSYGNWVPNTVRAGSLKFDSFDAHPDFPRSVNAFTAFSPYHLEPVGALLRDPKVTDFIATKAPPEVVEAYNHLSGCISAAMRSYEMDRSVMPLIFVKGQWL
ncbi:hypothetical protein Rhe02_03140 [Rhizocola hellebori]|uniref:Uncharacterized protein n=1 Tax=Rhizocola hellebori TaxID=1392758 RepID=A0A8J3VD95_9ACTN|nr:hypothetical protein [Rhizocola hellebori]GIH02247.1 hypothetical protein Rhe02_03140 [Rhizocola hellebori]